MKVTNVFLNKNQKGTIKGTAVVSFNEGLNVRFAIVQGRNGIFASGPSVKGKNGQFYPQVEFNTREEHDILSKAVEEAYEAKSAA